MYPHDGVDTSGLAALRALVLDRLMRTVPTYAMPILATSGPHVPGPAYALAEVSTAAGRRTRNSPAQPDRTGSATAQGTHARQPASDTDNGRMMDLVERAQDGETEAFGRLYAHYSDTVYRYI